MLSTNYSFGKLLEQYVLNTASLFIESACPEEQANLIKLLTRIDPTPTPTDDLVHLLGSGFEAPEPKKQQPLGFCELNLEKQWQEVLNKPIVPKSVYAQRVTTARKQRIADYQSCIDSTHTSILKMDILLEKASGIAVQACNANRLISYYQSVKRNYMTYLAKLEALQRKEVLKLG